MEEKLLPENQDYSDIHGLRLEARQKLNKIQPKSLGQASRISGVSPSDMSVLIVWLESQKKSQIKMCVISNDTHFCYSLSFTI